MRHLVEELKKQEVDGLALDLRNNGGGSLPDAIEMAGLFVNAGPVVQVRDARNVQVLSDPDPAQLYDGPMVVLVNRMSASASEIVAAALQDYGRAVIVGDSKTHGKGTVQTLLPLDMKGTPLGSYKVTTASFYRIAGGSTQMKGVASDIVIPSVFDKMELGEEFLPHAMAWSVVNPAFYAILLNATPPLDVLREKSEKRRAADPSFKVRKELLERLDKRLNAEEVSLNLDERVAMAKADKEMDELQKSVGDNAIAPNIGRATHSRRNSHERCRSQPPGGSRAHGVPAGALRYRHLARRHPEVRGRRRREVSGRRNCRKKAQEAQITVEIVRIS